jgi:hypothetical protein
MPTDDLDGLLKGHSWDYSFAGNLERAAGIGCSNQQKSTQNEKAKQAEDNQKKEAIVLALSDFHALSLVGIVNEDTRLAKSVASLPDKAWPPVL